MGEQKMAISEAMERINEYALIKKTLWNNSTDGLIDLQLFYLSLRELLNVQCTDWDLEAELEPA